MAQIRVGDVVRAHLDVHIKGKVIKILQETPTEYTSTGPMSQQIFCLVELDNGTVVKRKVTDLYIDYA